MNALPMKMNTMPNSMSQPMMTGGMAHLVNSSQMNKMSGGMLAVGTRAQVFHGTAHHTSGGLTKKDLFLNKRGRIVSKKASAAGKKAFSRLAKAGYKPKKGTFKLFTKKAGRKASQGGFF
jgi:hypothetical protein